MRASPCSNQRDTIAGVGQAAGDVVSCAHIATVASSGGCGQLAVQHLNAAYNLARWLTNDDAEAGDVVQQAYAEAFGCPGPAHVEFPLVPLLAIVRGACLDRLARRASAAAQRDQSGADPGSSAVASDVRHEVNGALQRLPFELLEVIVLREMEDLPHRAIACITGVPVGTVTSRLGCARAELVRYLGKSRTRPSDEVRPREAAIAPSMPADSSSILP